jgi:hypothetical protein
MFGVGGNDLARNVIEASLRPSVSNVLVSVTMRFIWPWQSLLNSVAQRVTLPR